MDQRTYHGPVTPDDLARALIAEFDHGNMRAQQVGEGENLMVQIASREWRSSGGATALSVQLSAVEDGVLVQTGEQQWLGVAASLGATALAALRNPMALIGRLDDVAQDIGSLQLRERVWATIDEVARGMGASHEISERLRRLTCPYCQTANPVGEPRCLACGAPLGPEQPTACPKCGFVSPPGAAFCSKCGVQLQA
jgi:hypothetical protein